VATYTHPENLNWKADNRQGYTRLARLDHIARLCPPLSLEALRIAIPESKSAKNPETYLNLVSLLREIDASNELAKLDVEWMERKTKENQKETERLDQELRGYKNNLIKESIRMGQEDLATHFLSMSDFESSQKAFQKMREYCTTPKHIAEMTVKLMYASIASTQWMIVQSHCAKLRMSSIKEEDKEKFLPAIEACSGLAHMGVEDYHSAAQHFIMVNPTFTSNEVVAGINFPKAVLTGNDVAVYGGLCALASMGRDDLRTKVLENPDFRTFLELESHVRRAISLFCDGKYSQCLATLESYRNDYLLDVYLSDHINDLYQRIRSKSIIQYFIPFSHVTLAALAAAFPRSGHTNTSVETMEQELEEMISSGLLNARIDTVDQLLVAPPKDTRAEAHRDVLETAREVEHQLRLKLHKINMFHANLELLNPKAAKGLKSGMGGMNPWESESKMGYSADI